MSTPGIGFAAFDTVIGRFATAWGEQGIVAVALPGAEEAETRARVQRHFPGAREQPPPPDVHAAIGNISALLRGEPSDLSTVVLDMRRVQAFPRRVYEVARAIPPGATLTYGEVAARLGASGAARAVGRALGENPFPIVVPCHRVVAANGKVGGFSAYGGPITKLRLLQIEGATAYAEPGLFDWRTLARPQT